MAIAGTAAANPAAYLKLAVSAFLLSLTLLSAGFLISGLARRTSVAMVIGLFRWLAFVFLGDLGMICALPQPTCWQTLLGSATADLTVTGDMPCIISWGTWLSTTSHLARENLF